MVLLAALISVWGKYVASQDRYVEFSVLVDDRALWSRATHAVTKVKEALDRATISDERIAQM